MWEARMKSLSRARRGKIDALHVECIEAVSAAAFLAREEKAPYVRLAIRKTDTIKLLLMVLWESKSLDTKKYAALSERMDEVGRMLGGWQGQLRKNSPAVQAGEK